MHLQVKRHQENKSYSPKALYLACVAHSLPKIPLAQCGCVGERNEFVLPRCSLLGLRSAPCWARSRSWPEAMASFTSPIRRAGLRAADCKAENGDALRIPDWQLLSTWAHSRVLLTLLTKKNCKQKNTSYGQPWRHCSRRETCRHG